MAKEKRNWLPFVIAGGVAVIIGYAGRKPLVRAATSAAGNLRRILDTFGDPGVPVRGQGAVKPAASWESRNIVPVRLHTGQKVRLHRKVAQNFADTFKAACEASGWTPKSVQTYVPRYMRGKTPMPLSLHTLGIAVDFDPGQNTRQKGAAHSLDAHPEFVSTFERNGWTWGGRWGKSYDPMHFEKRDA